MRSPKELGNGNNSWLPFIVIVIVAIIAGIIAYRRRK
jgi:LPXTG-motif cell wall-anchored protein